MFEKTLEFRGTPLSTIISYFNELAGRQETDTFPIRFSNPHWTVELLKEEEVQITSRFAVNALFIRFRSSNESALEDIITRFRKKMLRVGG